MRIDRGANRAEPRRDYHDVFYPTNPPVQKNWLQGGFCVSLPQPINGARREAARNGAEMGSNNNSMT